MSQVILPFKPYSFQEVCDVTGCPAHLVEHWVATNALTVHWGQTDRKDRGLDDRGTFAVYCGWRYLEEGAGADRARRTVMAVQSLPWEHLAQELRAGRSFLTWVQTVNKGAQAFLVAPPDSKLGRTLNLRQLLGDYNYRMGRAFPDHKPAVSVEGTPR